MPPAQCPECRRFLARSFVVGLEDAPGPCPRCGTELTHDRIGGGPSVDETDPAIRTGTAGSVRPPDLPPEEVRGLGDPLAGWDAGVPTELLAVRDERPFPLDTVVVVGAAALGFGLGAAFGRRPGRDAVLCGIGGAIGAGLTRRIWQLP